MMRRVISVTRRHVEFLFGAVMYAPKAKTWAEAVEVIKAMPIEEIRAYIARRQAEWAEEGSWQLPAADDDHVGEDV